MENKSYEFSRQPRFMAEIPRGVVEIPSPPNKMEQPEVSWFALLIPPAVMLIITVILALNAQSMYMLISIATTVMAVIGSVASATSQLKKYKKKKTEREDKYLQLIADIRADLQINREKQIQALNEMNPEPSICIGRLKSEDRKLWERTPAFDDFLSLRMGIGSIPSSVSVRYSKQPIQLEDDPLQEEPEKIGLEFEHVNQVPVCLDIFQSDISGIGGEEKRVIELLNLLLLQIITHHGYDDVKLVLLLKADSLEHFEWLKFAPHLWREDFKTRYLICGKTMGHSVLVELNEVLKYRELRNKSSHENNINLPHYVFVVEDSSLLENEAISKYLYHSNKALGISTVFVEQNKAYLPSHCKSVVSITGKNGEYANRETLEKSIFVLDKIDLKSLQQGALHLAPLRIKKSNMEFTLPKSITLAQMLGVRDFQSINIMEKWLNHRTYKGMQVPIGARAGGEPFFLDMHETGYGPHGLVAGTTGSGKSELLQSIIISLAINYHPHDVVFVLIDYKGGGMADVFKGMPHLVGTITNLGGNQTTRALLSIKSELQRRQRIFSEYEVNNIDKYQKLYYKDDNRYQMPAIPHLIMIADEFAELKQEQPDFMKELVSAARVGRSLGVHLILATQKPAGVVDDQIWSNSKFKLCLKVQDEADSNDVIKRPDAARIKEPGRAYIQVGNDEVFEMFQSAYSGADYDPDGQLQLSENKPKYIFKILLNGKMDRIYPLEEEKIPRKEVPTQLKAMVDYLSKIASEENIQPLAGPWEPPLDDTMSFTGELYFQKNEILSATIGIADHPRAQRMFPINIDFAKDGNLFVYGSAGTGKTTLLKTLALSLSQKYSPEEMNFYIMDFGGSSFKQFERLPHCGGVITLEEENKMNQFILFIYRIIEARKKIFEDSRCDSFYDFQDKKKGMLPGIVIMIDNYFALSETYEELDEKMIHLARDGGKYGIYLVATATNGTMVKYKLSVNFKMALTLLLTEKSEYDGIVGRTEGLEPKAIPGRGLLRHQPPLECHIFMPNYIVDNNMMDTEAWIQALEDHYRILNVGKAVPIPMLKDRIYIEELNPVEDGLVIGLNDNDLQPVQLNMIQNHVILLTGERGSGKSTILTSWVKTILKQPNRTSRVYAKDSNSMGIYTLMGLEGVNDINEIESTEAFVADMNEVLENRRRELNEARRTGGNMKEVIDSWEQIIFVFDNFTEFVDEDDYYLKEFLEKIVKKEHGMKIAILAAGNVGDFESNWDSLAKAVKDTGVGVLLGSIKAQGMFDVKYPYGMSEREFIFGDGYFIQKNRYIGLRCGY